ncbi:MAG: hypothetical protein V4651_12260 [Bacteroidota bacterium]
MTATMNNVNQPEYLYSTARLLAVGKGNPEFVKRMLTVFVQQMNDTTNQLNTYIHNPEQVYLILHQAKPSIADICNPTMHQLIEKIEILAKHNHTADMIKQVQVFLQRIQEVIQAIHHFELAED